MSHWEDAIKAGAKGSALGIDSDYIARGIIADAYPHLQLYVLREELERTTAAVNDTGDHDKQDDLIAHATILHETGHYDGWTVASGLTDMTGEFGDPRIETTWEKDGRRIKDIRYPSVGGGMDYQECEHYDLGRHPL